MTERLATGGPLDGLRVPRVRGAWAWVDDTGRSHEHPGAGRHLYYVASSSRLRFAGHGARQCQGCGAVLDPDEDGSALVSCPLCGAGR